MERIKKGFGVLAAFWVIAAFVGLTLESDSSAETASAFSKSRSQILLFSKDLKQTGAISTGFSPAFYTVNEDASLVYAASEKGDSLHVLDLSTGGVLKSIPFEGKITGAVYDQKRRLVYVVNQGSGKIHVLDAANFEIKSVVHVTRGKIRSFAFSPQRDLFYVGTSKKSLSVYSVENWTEVMSTPDLDEAARLLLISENLDRLIVKFRTSIAVYSLSTLDLVDSIDLEDVPGKVVLNSDGSKLFVELTEPRGNVAVYDVDSLEQENRVTVSNRTFHHKNVDTSTFAVGSNGESVNFLDEDSGVFFTKDDAQFVGKNAPIALPPGVTASADIGLNNSDNGVQSSPQCDFDAAGNFVATWTDITGGYDSHSPGILAREMNADLTPAAPDFVANEFAPGPQHHNNVGVAANGDYVICWVDKKARDGSIWGIYFRRFSKGGNPKSDDILATAHPGGKQTDAVCASDAAGNFVVGWGGPDDGDGRGTWVRRFDVGGNPIGQEVQANTHTQGDPTGMDLAMSDSGDFVIVWRDGDDDRIRGRAYKADGTPRAGANFQAGPFSPSALHNFAPAVGMAGDGSFLVAWKEAGAGGIVGQRFNPDQTEKGNPFHVTSAQTGNGDGPSVAMAPDGRHVVSFSDSGYGGPDIIARLFDATGTALGPDFEAPAEFANDEFESNAAMADNGNFFVSFKDRASHPSIAGRYFFVAPGIPAISITDATIAEGNAGTQILTFTVTLSNPSNDTVTVDFATANDTATAGSDYVAATGTVTFNPTVVSQPVSITINGDTTIEPNETFFVNLTNPTNATILDNQGVGTIQDDDTPPGISISDTIVAEGSGGTTVADFAITLTNAFSNVVTVQFDTQDDTALAGSDYLPVSLPVTFPIGVTEQHIQVIIIGDLANEGNETFFGKLSAATGGASINDDTGVCTIVDDESLFSDNFDDGDLNHQWTFTPNASSWTEAGGFLVESAGGKSSAIASPVFTGCDLCSIHTKFRVSGTGSNTVTILAWYAGKNNDVELQVKEKADKWILKRKGGKKVTVKQPITADTDYTVDLSYDGTQYIVIVNGVQLTTLATKAPAVGTVGFKVKGGAGSFDYIQVTP